MGGRKLAQKMTAILGCWPVFDMRQSSFHGLPFIYIGVVVTVAGVAVAFIRRNDRMWIRWGTALFACAVTILVTVVGVANTVADRNALSKGQCLVVEGVVEALTPVPEGMKGSETLQIAKHAFSYSDFNIRPGMNVSERKAIHLAVGQFVRVYCRGDQILRIERCAR